MSQEKPIPEMQRKVVFNLPRRAAAVQRRTDSFFPSNSAWSALRSFVSCCRKDSLFSDSPAAMALIISSCKAISRPAIFEAYSESNSASCFFWASESLLAGEALLSLSMAISYDDFIMVFLGPNVGHQG